VASTKPTGRMTSTGTSKPRKKPPGARLPKRVAGDPPKGWWPHAAWVLDKTTGFLFVFVLLAASGGLLVGIEQGRDLLRAVAEPGDDGLAHSAPFGVLLAAAFWLGLNAWFWCRAIVQYQFGAAELWQKNLYLTWAPRLLGALPFGVLAFGLAEIDQVSWRTGSLLGLGGGFLVFLMLRRPLAEQLHRSGQQLIARGYGRAGRAIHATLASGHQAAFWGSLGLAVAGVVVLIVAPAAPAQALGPAAVALLALAMIIPVMTVLIQAGHERRIATVPALFALAFLASFHSDNHPVRLMDPPSVRPRPSVQAAFDLWRTGLAAGPKGVPIIFVVSQGGASRAGYWTGAAMSQLEEDTGGQFSRHVFAISSISGGSLGAAGFLAAIHDQPQLTAARRLRARVGCFTSQDYLSPPLGGLLGPDLVQRFIPWPVLPDRAQALEGAWEAGWGKSCDQTKGQAAGQQDDRLRQPFLSLWGGPADRWLPILLVGGAMQETGRPLITSSIDLWVGGVPRVDADDFHTLAAADVRLSTAILNGARFPYISPGGTLPNGWHVEDGGFFDATGVEAVRELAQAMFAPGKGVIYGPDGAPVVGLRPIYLEILNGEGSASAKPASFSQDLMGPLRGLFHSREAHGALLRRNLEAFPPGIGGATPEVIRISLCEPIAMDWALSEQAIEVMDRNLKRDIEAAPAIPARRGKPGTPARPACKNGEAFQTLTDILAGRR
jgi:hypothetical protein